MPVSVAGTTGSLCMFFFAQPCYSPEPRFTGRTFKFEGIELRVSGANLSGPKQMVNRVFQDFNQGLPLRTTKVGRLNR